MRYLVTGGACFIGSHLTHALLGVGHDVTVVDNLSTGSTDNLEAIGRRARFVHGSVLNPLLVDELVASTDVVVRGIRHRAVSFPRMSMYDQASPARPEMLHPDGVALRADA